MRATTIRRIAIAASVLVLVATTSAPAFAYCLTGVRWASTTQIYYNSQGKVTSGQCISSGAMDSAVTGGAISAWGRLHYNGTTNNKANRRDGQNTVGWARLGGQTLGVTNYLQYGNPIVSCGGNNLYTLFEADVRLSTSYRWTSTGTQCPCAAGAAIFLNAVSEHEFGHVAGLCHTNNPSSLMYPSFGVCENKSSGSDENAGENALCP